MRTPHYAIRGDNHNCTTPVDAPHYTGRRTPQYTGSINKQQRVAQYNRVPPTKNTPHAAHRYPHPRHSPRCCLRSSRPTCRGCHTVAECDNNRRDSVCRRDSVSPQLLCPTHAPTPAPTPPATPHSRSSGARGRCQRAEDRTQRGERRAPRKKQGRPPHAKYHALGPLPGFH